jgi:hypothetical protein
MTKPSSAGDALRNRKKSMQQLKLAALAVLLTLHAMAGADDQQPHIHNDPIEAIEEKHQRKERE